MSSLNQFPAHPLWQGKGPVSIAQFNVICRSMTSSISRHYHFTSHPVLAIRGPLHFEGAQAAE